MAWSFFLEGGFFHSWSKVILFSIFLAIEKKIATCEDNTLGWTHYQANFQLSLLKDPTQFNNTLIFGKYYNPKKGTNVNTNYY